MNRKPKSNLSPVKWLALFAVLVLPSLSIPTNAQAQARSSSTINGITITVIGGGNQQVGAHEDGVRAVLNGQEVIASKERISVGGKSFDVEPYREIVVESLRQWGLKVSADGKTVHEISDLAGLQAAAERGNPMALNNLGVRLLKGDGVSRDVDRAVQLYRNAAEKGSVEAHSNLAHLYWDGREIPRNPSEAISWAQKAAERGSESALFILGRAHETGDGVTKDLETAVRWYEKSADAGQAPGLNNLAYYYLKGEIVEKDVEKAIGLYKSASDLGHGTASNNLGIIYRNGTEADKDLQLSAHYFEKAVEQDHPLAAESLRTVKAELSQAKPGMEPASVIKVANPLPAAPPPLPQNSDNGPPPLPNAAPSASQPPPLPRKQIFFAVDGRQQGPVDENELAARVRAGEVDGQTLIWQKGMDSWVAIAEVAEFAALIAEETVPEPPQPQYFVIVQGQQQGPIGPQQIKSLADSNQINADTLVWTDGMTSWQPLRSQPVLATLVTPKKGPPPLPGQPAAPRLGATDANRASSTTGNTATREYRMRSYCSITGKEGIGTGSTRELAAKEAIRQCVANGGLPNCCPNNITVVQ